MGASRRCCRHRRYVAAAPQGRRSTRALGRGTHEYAKLIKPSELAALCRAAGPRVERVVGISYNPFTKAYTLSPDPDVNSILHAKPG